METRARNCVRASTWALAAVLWYLAVPAGAGQVSSPPFVVPLSPDGVQRTKVILDSYSYSPNHLIVEAGKPVELTLTSVTTLTPHNFIIKNLAPGVSIEHDVGAGKTVVITFTPTQPGLYPFYCDKRLWPLPSHRDKGMEGLLEVK